MSVRLVLAKGREKSLLRRHPWVFSGAVARMEGKASLGETIDIVDHQGKWLARGAYSPASQIRARVWTFDQHETIDIAFFTRRLQQAQQWRDWLAQRDGLDSYRLIAGESDGMPGVTIDRFGNFLVLQLLSAGAEYQRAALISALQSGYPECAIYDRSDVAVRKKEGMELTQGPVTGELPPALLPIEEHGMKLLVDIQGGHKTGYYLDQRDSRLATRQYVKDKRVLNCFSYTGGFAVSALMGGCANVVSVVMMPKIAGLVEEMTGLRFRNKRASAFGSHGWSGGAVDRLSTRLQDAGFEMSMSLKAKWRPDIDALEICRQHGRDIARQWALAPLPEVAAKATEQQEACACAAAAAAELGPRMQCSVCQWIYDPELGEPLQDVAPGTPWSDVPDNFLCPECSLGKDVFDELATEAK
jgi:rubredoxin